MREGGFQMIDRPSEASSRTQADEDAAFRIISREEWGARPAEAVTPWDPNDLFGVVVHWFGIPPASRDHDRCDDLVRSVQQAHQAGEFNDIAYNHLFCPHGFAYEGRGFERQTGANGTTTANKRYASICFMAGMRRASGVTDDELLKEIEQFSKMSACGCDGMALVISRGLVTQQVDPFPELAQDVGGWLLAEWFKRGTDRVVRCHGDITGSSCPGPAVRDWVVTGEWKADLPTADVVRFELWDDGGKVEQSAPMAVADEEAGLEAFLDHIDTTLLQRLRDEPNPGAVQVRRRLLVA